MVFILITPVRLMLPLKASYPLPAKTGRLSPVSEEWSILLSPSVIIPSIGILSPGDTVITVHTATFSQGVSKSLPSFSTNAMSGLISISFSMLFLLLPKARR